MDPTPEMRFAIDQEMQRRGRMFKKRLETTRTESVSAPEIKILAHGDSWFDYPLNGNSISFHGPTDIIQQLDPTSENDEDPHLFRATGPRYVIHNVSHYGYATTDEMSRQGQLDMQNALDKYWKPTGVTPQAILFSGGGNDIVGDQFAIYLNDNSPSTSTGDTGLNADRFAGALARVEASYRCLFAFRDKHVGNAVPIYGHAYDFAIPDGRFVDLTCKRIGPWLRPSLQFCGYDYDQQQHLCRAIVKTALQKFRDRLVTLAAEPLNNFHLVETQGTLTDDKLWGNELHPIREGFAKIADKFRAALDARFGNTI